MVKSNIFAVSGLLSSKPKSQTVRWQRYIV
jgi:hypothetical protein